MKAVCLIRVDDTIKQITKSGKKQSDLVSWLVEMSKNPRFIMGWAEDGEFAIVDP